MRPPFFLTMNKHPDITSPSPALIEEIVSTADNYLVQEQEWLKSELIEYSADFYKTAHDLTSLLDKIREKEKTQNYVSLLTEKDGILFVYFFVFWNGSLSQVLRSDLIITDEP